MSETTQQVPARPRALRDPAALVWGITSVGWAVCLILIITGGMAAGHHDTVLSRSDQNWPSRLLIFVAVWTVMVAAMMVPSTLPVARAFARVNAHQPRPTVTLLAFFGAYLTVWTGFAGVALAFDAGIHALAERWTWLAQRPELILAGALGLAGLYQFSPAKDACLRACRTPFVTVVTGYRRGVAGAWSLGLRHGLSCLGCCWALMLVMFATGVGSLLWMVLLGVLMTAEKTFTHGKRWVAPIGIGLLIAAVLVSVPALARGIV